MILSSDQRGLWIELDGLRAFRTWDWYHLAVSK